MAADPNTIAAASSMVANGVGGIIGLFQKNAADEQALALQRQAVQQWLDLNVPDPEQQKIYLQRLKSEGQLNPQLESALTLGDSEFKNISVDPSYKSAQLEALSSLGDVATSGGMTLEDKATQQAAMADSAAAERGSRGAIEQNMAARGISGSGLELAAKLSNQQAGAERGNIASLNTAASARARALEAMMQKGTMAGSLRSQEYGEQKDAASAQDIIKKFNTQNRQDVQQRNVDAQNAAQMANLQEKQRISDGNAGLANQEQVHNTGLLQQQYNNQAGKAAGLSGQYSQTAGMVGQQGKDTAAAIAGVGQGVGQAALGYGDYFNKKKKDPAGA